MQVKPINYVCFLDLISGVQKEDQLINYLGDALNSLLMIASFGKFWLLMVVFIALMILSPFLISLLNCLIFHYLLEIHFKISC